ncbi:MAG TPA: Maf family protein [Candidatus Margulisiibacteriota bacterium]|nr:Maf family protein [Candidatus Margulisiibacteriota bacterium]
MKVRLVLASASPRRRELLAQLAVPFEVVTSDVPETPCPGELPDAFARRVARDKAAAVARRCPDALVLAADTVVVVDGVILGKPRDRADARRMLAALSGRTHEVLTAVVLIDPGHDVEDLVVRSSVEFRSLAADEIERYLDSTEPYDKAGAYAVQGAAQRFVRAVHGSYTNVVGLPVDEVRELVRRHAPMSLAAAPAVS